MSSNLLPAFKSLTKMEKLFIGSILFSCALGIYMIFYFIVAVTALGTIGVNVASLITALGAAALTAGLALQDLLKNVVSGLVILINKPFVSGNILDFEGVKGTVEEINIFSTTYEKFTA